MTDQRVTTKCPSADGWMLLRMKVQTRRTRWVLSVALWSRRAFQEGREKVVGAQGCKERGWQDII